MGKGGRGQDAGARPHVGVLGAALPVPEGRGGRLEQRAEFFEEKRDWLRQKLGLSPPRHEWLDWRSDAALERFCFESLGMHRLERQAEPHGGYCVKFGPTRADLEVRPGLAPYGASAFFNAQKEVTHIELPPGTAGRLRRDGDAGTRVLRVRPGDADWEVAKFQFRSSLAMDVFVLEHACAVHMVFAHAMAVACRETLPPDHPIRILLAVFCFGTIHVNDKAANALLPENGLVHRAFAFTGNGLRHALTLCTASLRYDTYPRAFDQDLGTPFDVDGKEYRDSIQCFLAAYLRHEGEWFDDSVLSMWRALKQHSPEMFGLPEPKGSPSDAAVFTEVLCKFIFVCTAMHNHVGEVTEFYENPEFCASKWASGDLCAGKDAALQTCSIVALTACDQLSLLDDWPSKYREWTVDPCVGRARERVAREFQDRLRELDARVAERNKSRAVPCFSFMPSKMETSVAK